MAVFGMIGRIGALRFTWSLSIATWLNLSSHFGICPVWNRPTERLVQESTVLGAFGLWRVGVRPDLIIGEIFLDGWRRRLHGTVALLRAAVGKRALGAGHHLVFDILNIALEAATQRRYLRPDETMGLRV